MWPTNRGYLNAGKQLANGSDQQSIQPTLKSMASVDNNQLLMAAQSLRTLFGDPNMLDSVRENPATNRMETSLSQMTSRRPTDRNVIEYENPNYSRLDRSLLSRMSTDFGSTDQRFSDLSPSMRTEARTYDPNKMPQKSILKKSKDSALQSYDSMFRDVEDEDMYLYGNTSVISGPSGSQPPGREPLNERSPPNERPLSPISLRLKREMEKMDRSRHQSTEPNEDNHWTPRIGLMSGTATAEEPVRRNEWNDEEEDLFKRRYRSLMNPSPDRTLELEKVRIQQMAAIQAGILTHADQNAKRREMSPKSPLRHSDYTTYRRSSPEMSPKRVRRRSPSVSPQRRRSISPRRRSRSPRQRSRSPRRRSRTPPRRSTSPRSRRSPPRSYSNRSRSRDRYRRTRSRSRTPPRRSSPPPLAPHMNLMNPINPMPQMMRIPAPGMPFMPPHNLVGAPMGPLMTQFMGPSPMPGPFHSFVPNIRPNIPINISPNKRTLKDVPIDKTTGAKTFGKKPAEKKEDKLLNPHDLLVAERAKLRDELELLKRQFQRKKDEQELIAKKDGGTDSYAYRQLDKAVKELRNAIESKHDLLIKNFELISDVQKSKSKAKAVMNQLKTSGDISKVDLKKKEKSDKSKSSPQKNTKSPDKKSPKEQPKDKKEEKVDEDEEEEKTSRFHYFDSGPHWCQDCNKFFENMKQYFIHTHSKDHLTKQKESLKTPWITKGYIKEMEKPVPRNKDQLVVASKGIQFILPTQGFFCELCDQFLHDSYQAEKHFKSAKHNRSYTRYTLLHNNYEHKWKGDRDRAYTEMKRKEREAEKEKSKKEAEKKIEDRKRLEEEVKRKDREVKQKIEAMNKSLKSVKELDDPKTDEHKKDDKSKSSPKSSIRLNLTSSKSSIEVNVKSSPEKSSDKKDKTKDKSEERSLKSINLGESMDTTEGMEDMLIIDEINCDSMEDNTESQTSTEIIVEKENVVNENDHKSDPKTDEINENVTENSFKTNEVINLDTSGEEVSQKSSLEKSSSVENISETNDENEAKVKNAEQMEGVMPEVSAKIDSNDVINEDLNVSEPTVEDNPKPNEDLNEIISEDKSNNEISKVDQNLTTESTEPQNKENSNGCADTPPKTYAEVVAKGVEESEDKVLKTPKMEGKSPERVDESDSIDREEPKPNVLKDFLDSKDIKTENMFDFDIDIENFNERLKNFDSMIKKENIETEVDEEDPLDGFDVIDETNNSDTLHVEEDDEENSSDVIVVSD